MKRFYAFTLAEVLITLGIIGTVAALTMPSLIQQHRKHVIETRLKKAYTTLSNALKLSQIDNDNIANWPLETSAGEYIKKYFSPYLNNSKICYSYDECNYKSFAPFKKINGEAFGTSVAVDRARLPLVLNDGIYIIFNIGYISDGEAINDNSGGYMAYIDINGAQEPNTYGKDLFIFIMNKKGVVPNCPEDDTANDCNSEGTGFNCSCDIVKNNWSIPDNYPVKL